MVERVGDGDAVSSRPCTSREIGRRPFTTTGAPVTASTSCPDGVRFTPA